MLFKHCLFLLCCIELSAETTRITFETICADTISKQARYAPLNKGDHGHHATLIKLHNLPDALEYTLEISRPLLENAPQSFPVPAFHCILTMALLGEQTPIYALSSRGYLPGELITCQLKTKDAQTLGAPITFTPNPIILEHASDGARMHAELLGVQNANYILFFEGLKEQELIMFNSRSDDETISTFFIYEDHELLYAPATIGKSGGYGDLTLTRANGATFHVKLPWGKALIDHNRGTEPPPVTSFAPIKGE